jgi:hypothetical protein
VPECALRCNAWANSRYLKSPRRGWGPRFIQQPGAFHPQRPPAHGRDHGDWPFRWCFTSNHLNIFWPGHIAHSIDNLKTRPLFLRTDRVERVVATVLTEPASPSINQLDDGEITEPVALDSKCPESRLSAICERQQEDIAGLNWTRDTARASDLDGQFLRTEQVCS